MTGGRQEAARQLLTFARTEFGEHLSALLLSGYGDGRRALARFYDVAIREGGRQEKKRVKLVTDDPSDHPCQDEPLVLLTLLKLLWLSGDPLETKIDYATTTLSRMLGRPDTPHVRASIDQTVERYYNLSLKLEEDLPSAAGKRPLTRILTQRLLIGYDHLEETSDDGDRRDEGRVAFHPDFIRALKERSLLGIDWERVDGCVREVADV